MGQYYEVVIYTDEQALYADPVINRLDGDRVVPYRLYRADTQYDGGRHVRDLSKLNRDLEHVLFISGECVGCLCGCLCGLCVCAVGALASLCL